MKRTKTKRFKDGKETYEITVTLRFDDQCKNGHDTFSITGSIDRVYPGRRIEHSGGCIHEEIVQHFPEFAHLIKWHNCTTDGPLHYADNTAWHAGARDCHGFLHGEPTGKEHVVTFGNNPIQHHLEESFYDFLNAGRVTDKTTVETVPHATKSETFSAKATLIGYDQAWHACAFDTAKEALQFLQAWRTCDPTLAIIPSGCAKGKTRDFSAARNTAIWPEATAEQLSLDRKELIKLLEARLPELMKRFNRAMQEARLVK